MIVSHGTCMKVLLSTWCDIKLDSNGYPELWFNNKPLITDIWNSPELFKLVFEDEKLVEITNDRNWMKE